MNDHIRFRPYIRHDMSILFDRLREATGLSSGKILTRLLTESETYQQLIEIYYTAENEELNDVFMGLCSSEESCDNKEKKEQ